MPKLVDYCERAMIYISTVSVFILMLLTTADAGGRYFFNRPITGANEVTTSYLMIAAVFLGVSYGYREGAYIRVTFLASRFPAKLKLAVNCFVQMLSVLYGLLLVIATYKQALLTIESHTALISFDFIPLGPAYMIVPVGLFFMLLAMLFDIRKVSKGKSALFSEESPTD